MIHFIRSCRPFSLRLQNDSLLKAMESKCNVIKCLTGDQLERNTQGIIPAELQATIFIQLATLDPTAKCYRYKPDKENKSSVQKD